jgi:hypothetical protein
MGKLKVEIRKTGDGGPGSADVIVGRCERIESNPLPRQKIRSERRSAPRPGSAPPATVAALPRVLVCQSDFFSRGGAESVEGGRLDFLRVLRGSA